MKLENYPQNFETERLKIRPLNLDDMIVWRKFLADEKTTTYFPAYMKDKDELHALLWIEKQICRYRDKKGGLMALIEKESGRFIGQCGLLVQDVDGVSELEIGYHLMPEFWGRGFASEAANFFREIAFATTTVSSIVSIIAVKNTPSQNVAIRNGMQRSARILWRELDVYIYRITRHENALLRK
jgi:RimJ/RimL family protein N-acetyltransferase